MFGLFKSKSKLEVLQSEYEKLMKDWHKLSSIDRAKSDMKYVEAQKILDQIEVLQQSNS